MTESEDPQNQLAELPASTKRFAIGAVAVLVIATGVLAFGGLGENLVYYWDASQLQANKSKAQGATIRLGGQVEPGSIVQGESLLKFNVTDGKASVAVEAKGLPPAMFRESIGVVVEGSLRADGVFTSERLLVSHDNEYRAPEEGEQANVQELSKTATGVGGE